MSRHKALAVKGVIFDMDGTLADSVEYFYQVSLEVLKIAGIPLPSRDRVYALMRVGDDNPLAKLFPPDHPDPAATLKRIVDSRMDTWMEHYRHKTEAIPGSLELLKNLHARGLRLGIATSSGRDLPFLDHWGVRHLFSGIIGREDVENRKPHPEPILKCLERLALQPHEAVYIGDSPIDVQASRAAGSHTVGVLTGTSSREVMVHHAPDYILESVAELPNILAAEYGG